MERFTKESIIKERLLHFLNNHGNERKQINFLKDCLINSGYMKRWNEVENTKDIEDDDFNEFKEYERLRLTPEQNRYQKFYDYDIDLPEGDIVNYASGIESNVSSDKLQKTQQRGITHEEQLLGIVNELYENTLSQMGIENNVKNQALNMYKQLLNYYQTNILKLKINKGSLKKGYFGIILYYTLINNDIIIKKNVLTSLLGIELKDLPEAEKNIKLIFKDQPKFFSTNNLNLCNMKEILPKDIVKNIYDVIKKMKETFGDPMNQAQIAACIYYVCKRNKTKINNKLVTYDMVSKNCDGNPTSKTIKENVDLIKFILGE